MLYKAGSYMRSAQGGGDMLKGEGDMQGILDHKYLRVFTCKTTFARFLWCLSFNLILTIGEIHRQS